jgi:glycosyltransferase involved in cell wall biosynthesis
VSAGLRIAVTADPFLPVPPVHYGGIERIVHLLLVGLVERGHRPVLFAHPSSVVSGVPLVPYGAPPHTGFRRRAQELAQLGAALWYRRHEVDVIHSFGRLAALAPVLALRDLPKIQSYQRAIPWTGVRRAVRFAGRSLTLTACSGSLRALHADDPAYGTWETIVNGVPLERFQLSAEVPGDAPLAFLGRFDAIKGAREAIAIATLAGRRLVLAGPRQVDGSDARYFDEHIAPHVDGDRVRYVGPVDDAAKNSMLGSCAALLMPIAWDEPFGIVMAEAFACGTPVVAFRRGSVPEIVHDGVTGFICETVEQAASAVRQLARIDRASVRRSCEARFSAGAVVDAYERLYDTLVRHRRVAA